MQVKTQRIRLTSEWLKVSALVLTAFYLACLLFVTVSKTLMRHRAERLLAEMRRLQVGKSSWDDLQGIRTRWAAWGSSDGTCNKQHCAYRVSFTDVPGQRWFAAPIFHLRLGHEAYVTFGVGLDNGVVTRTQFGFVVVVPKGYGSRWERKERQRPGYVPYSSSVYALYAKASSSLIISNLCCEDPHVIPHPDYLVRKPEG